jgi:hypothetical protein
MIAACDGTPPAVAPTRGAPDEAWIPPAQASPPPLASVDAGSAQAIESTSSGGDAGQATSSADAASAAQAGTIPCKSADDCWISGDTTAAKPIRRPAKLRGKKFRPCVDGEAAPVCRGGVCGTLAYGC